MPTLLTQVVTADMAEVCKRTSLLRRRQDMTVAAFRAHWAGPHADIARTVPGIACYTQNRVEQVLWTSAPEQGAYACDGLVELEFENALAMQVAGGTAAVQQQLPEDERRFLQGITLCRTVKGARQIWHGQTKVMLAARLSEVLDSWPDLESLIRATGCVAYSVEAVASSFRRTQLAHESWAPQLFATLWFNEKQAAFDAFSSQSEWSKAAPGLLERATVWWVDPLPIVA